MPLDHRKNRIGRHILELLIQYVQTGQMNLQTAKQIASFYISSIKSSRDEKELEIRVITLYKTHPQMVPVVRSERISRLHA